MRLVQNGMRQLDAGVLCCANYGRRGSTPNWPSIRQDDMQAGTRFFLMTEHDMAPYVFSRFDSSNSKISVMKQALRLCSNGCGRRQHGLVIFVSHLLQGIRREGQGIRRVLSWCSLRWSVSLSNIDPIVLWAARTFCNVARRYSKYMLFSHVVRSFQ